MERNGIPLGLNRIRTRCVPSDDQSSSGGDESPALSRLIPEGEAAGDGNRRDGSGKGIHKGRKIARWLSSYFSPKDSYKAFDIVSRNTNVKRFESKMQSNKDLEGPYHSSVKKDLTGNLSLQEHCSVRKTTLVQKSFSHELGPRGGIRPSNIRARSYSDLKELLGSLHTKFDAVKEAVNAELAAFAGYAMDALEKDSSLNVRGTANELLILAQRCMEMTSSQFRENCESIVQDLAMRRQQCQAGMVKHLLTRMLFILTHCTRLLQFQKDTGPINEDSLDKFKKCLESVPAVDMKLFHKTTKVGFNLDKCEEDAIIPKHLSEEQSKCHRVDDSLPKEKSCEPKCDSVLDLEECAEGSDSVLCRICEESVPASHLESHSYICAYADKCDLEGTDMDERMLKIADILEEIVECYNQSLCASSSSPEISTIQSATSILVSEGHSQQEWHNKGMEGMFEDLHEMDTACIDDPHVAPSNNLKTLLAMKLGSCHPASSNGSMTPASSTATPRSSHFDLFWLEHNNPSEPEDVNQMNELADIARRATDTNPSNEGASEYLSTCLCDLLNILQHSQQKALVIDTFGSRIKKLLKEKYHLAVELMRKRQSNNMLQLEEINGNDVMNRSPIIASLRPSHKERTNIDDFEIIKPISRGAFGKVFLARKRTTGDLFAIKVLKKLDMIRKNDIERILAERNILIAVRNPFVVRFFYSFTCRDNLYLVMEYLNGGDLYSLLRKIGCLEEDVARIYIAELVLALEYLHSLGIIHRDLKPDNILIARDGHIKLTDFGLSKIGLMDSSIDLSGSGIAGSILLDAQKQHVFPDRARQRGKRRRSSAVGTPDYLAPEILLGTAHGYAADWWSVGIILFELITGIPPFTARLPEMIFDNILTRKIPWPRVPDDMSCEAKDLIDRFLTQDQDRRLGANGASEVKAHPFFKEINWDNLSLQKAAFIPQPDSADDTSYFMSRHSSISSPIPVDENSSDCASEATKTSSSTSTETNMDECSELKEFDSHTSLDLSSINFSFKNLSQLASMNYDVLLQSGRTSKCSSPSQGQSSS